MRPELILSAAALILIGTVIFKVGAMMLETAVNKYDKEHFREFLSVHGVNILVLVTVAICAIVTSWCYVHGLECYLGGVE